ncbi:hypothetical protein BDV25DRAFT_151712 [Aspergillus avenaceus]|uniref:TRP C-terminal domain-containing protein n=1 Tax=Aspergillus avenaceus TaxID=36643 RepID=A0A5N6U0E6_ASPAV|nr:hypothetical protein BDV25DRAFT_151712 [Aspergillus avenaceus]
MRGFTLRVAFLWFLSSLINVQAAFIRRLECSSSDNALVNPVFEPSTLSGYLTSDNDVTTLSLKLTGDYDSDTCDIMGGELAHLSIDAQVLGHSVITDNDQVAWTGTCPELSPLRYPRSDPRTYAVYRASYALDHAFRMRTLVTTIRLRLNDSDISCMAANITPYVGSTASGVLKAIPAIIMVLTGIITAALKIARTRGSMFRYEFADAFRDPVESYLPGMGDCLQYIQFIFLTGCLSVSYPGFFRGATSELAWSSLIFKNWPVTHEFIYPGVEDNIYAINATYGLEEMSQTLGATTLSDLWANAVVNLALVVLGVVVAIQVVSLCKWAWQLAPLGGSTHIPDLKTEFISHVQHTAWTVARIILDYFLHPIVAFSMYQPTIAKWFPVYQTFIAVAFVAILAASMAFTVRYLVKTDRQHKFFHHGSFPRQPSGDWLSDTLYGVPFIRGIAIGTLQQSGVGQILVLMTCELFIIGCLLWSHRTRFTQRAWRHASMATLRFISLGMGCAFLPSAGLSEGSKTLVAYIMIGLHAGVMIGSFIINCVYELVMFILFKLGLSDIEASGSDHGSQKAPVFGITQLARRSTRRTSFARLPALHPTEISTPYTYSQRPGTPRRPSFHGDLTINTEHPSFFRAPRSDTRSDTRTIASTWSAVSPSSPSSSSQSESSDSERSMQSVELDILDLNAKMEEDVDYSYRESDMYYGRPVGVPAIPPVSQPVQPAPAGSSTGAKRLWKWKRKQKEKGFEVIRPPRSHPAL